MDRVNHPEKIIYTITNPGECEITDLYVPGLGVRNVVELTAFTMGVWDALALRKSPYYVMPPQKPAHIFNSIALQLELQKPVRRWVKELIVALPILANFGMWQAISQQYAYQCTHIAHLAVTHTLPDFEDDLEDEQLIKDMTPPNALRTAVVPEKIVARICGKILQFFAGKKLNPNLVLMTQELKLLKRKPNIPADFLIYGDFLKLDLDHIDNRNKHEVYTALCSGSHGWESTYYQWAKEKLGDRHRTVVPEWPSLEEENESWSS